MEQLPPTPVSIDLITNETVDTTTETTLLHFLKTFSLKEGPIYSHLLTQKGTIILEHLNSFNPKLYSDFLNNPLKISSMFHSINPKISFYSLRTAQNFEELRSSSLNKLIKTSGIVVSISRKYISPLMLNIICRTCHKELTTKTVPRNCEPNCGMDPFVIRPEKGINKDLQFLKLQQNFDTLAKGELPKHLNVYLDDADNLSAGQSIELIGVVCSKNNQFYLKSLGYKFTNSSLKKLNNEKILEFYNLHKTNLFENISSMIAPQIDSNLDIKKTILLQQLGGVQKSNVINSRGFINILLMGDPGVAKSQLLKAASEIATNSVYTSGKAATAAGLTATVIRNSDGQFLLEAGALVIADRSVCCIDEFDKMNDEDRVAIHEAMEQGTISINKAGITTMLNCRTAVLAAANPIYGRYNSMKSLSENICMESTILSRFDCIFVLKDEINTQKDEKLARHLLNINTAQPTDTKDENKDSNLMLKNYIQYAKTNFNPTLSSASKKLLKEFYLEMRSFSSPIPITVRQLEAIIRLTEAHAKLHLRDVCTPDDVREAIRLFNISTLKAAKMGLQVEGMSREKFSEQIELIIKKLNNNIQVNNARRTEKLIESVIEQIDKTKFESQDEGLIRNQVLKGIELLVKQEKYVMRDDGQIIVRMV